MIPSVRTIMSIPGVSREQAKQIRKIMEDASSSCKACDEAMVRIDKVLGTHGTEAIRCREWIDRYHQDIRIVYCNAGDTYAWTVLFDTEAMRFSVGCYGDMVERLERIHGEEYFQP